MGPILAAACIALLGTALCAFVHLTCKARSDAIFWAKYRAIEREIDRRRMEAKLWR